MERLDGSACVRDAQTYAIIGAAMEVHRTLGYEFLEPAYQAALEIEFRLKEIPHKREVEMPIHYKGVTPASSIMLTFSVLVQYSWS